MSMRRATMALTVTLSLTSALQAQTTQPRKGLFGGKAAPARGLDPFNPAPQRGTPRTPNTDAAPAADDSGVRKATGFASSAPEPIPYDELEKPRINLPDVPLEPYILTKEQGPFMIMAHAFRGPDATKFALALVLELQNDYNLPSYVFHMKIHPGGSNIRNAQPTAPQAVPNAEVGTPEKYRVFDEAAVLVGNCKTLDEAEKLLKIVKKLHPTTLDGLPTIWSHRKGLGLARAHITANPLQAAQNLYPSRNPKYAAQSPGAPNSAQQPGETFDPFVASAAFEQNHKPDPLIKRMNGGPHSIAKCTGPFTFQIAEFTGRTAADANNPRFGNETFLKKSPLVTAADDAETLAQILEKCKSLDRSIKPFVYHDRFRSVVTLGAFTGPDDPRFVKLQKELPNVLGEILQKHSGQMTFSYELKSVPRF